MQASPAQTSNNTLLPKLHMPDNNLSFSLIEKYKNYKIVASHYRTDKKELRYILANPTAFAALKNHKKVLPDGSKIVKIGWSVKKMELYPDALEADTIQRIEFMYKDKTSFNHKGDHWGYARFIKKGDNYLAWNKGTQGCITCHSVASENDYLFTKIQE